MTAPPPTTLKTERLLLRRAVEADLTALHEIMADAQTMRFWSTPPHADLDTTRQWLASMIGAPASTSDDFIIDLDGVAIGKLGAWRLPEIGFLLARRHWGRGYAGEALAAFVAHAFSGEVGFLIADVDPRNTACLALLSRAGFRETGRALNTWQVGEAWCDSVYLRLDRPPA
ncbi:MAG: GNAT family N-acetyltransferase [Alphaproteobacteria bacterium]|nr:GNAT family N-acetyltransferase [Alphaproteobacteria bacterium]MBU1514406.1 GNAT family N-acetyltransferase [Alphaproteobacteria bacterium]MBU2096050.1 GNAT family N-acetyltransferase [Alphaproteobacteria bacterium]MBU2150092.1 GNAT family N-acetyltransferase [Alphaproteobacteria bacterium]MBU2308605.1 GNAT family N-acetyltransferase [Alphaproteobacteria bacterium]